MSEETILQGIKEDVDFLMQKIMRSSYPYHSLQTAINFLRQEYSRKMLEEQKFNSLKDK